VDPAFFLLPLLVANGARYSPLSQYLAATQGAGGGAIEALRGLDGLHASMAALCDVNTVMGHAPDELLYRLNRGKASAHLAARARRLAATLHAQSDANTSRLRAQMGSFAAASDALPAAAMDGGGGGGAASPAGAGGEGGARPAPGSSAELTLTALGLLSEYIADEWTEAVAGVLGCVTQLGRCRHRAPFPLLLPPSTFTLLSPPSPSLSLQRAAGVHPPTRGKGTRRIRGGRRAAARGVQQRAFQHRGAASRDRGRR
jgi:hypothetical protein